ncbi:MAG: acylphosphatase [Candidatus Roizmanbacteria bacterium]
MEERYLEAHVYIKGDVIGMGFRAWTKIQAKLNEIKGWARNNHEQEDRFGVHGGIEAVFQGKESSVERMISLVKEGPSIAHVDDVEVFWKEPKEIFEGFEIRK